MGAGRVLFVCWRASSSPRSRAGWMEYKVSGEAGGFAGKRARATGRLGRGGRRELDEEKATAMHGWSASGVGSARGRLEGENEVEHLLVLRREASEGCSGTGHGEEKRIQRMHHAPFNLLADFAVGERKKNRELARLAFSCSPCDGMFQGTCWGCLRHSFAVDSDTTNANS